MYEELQSQSTHSLFIWEYDKVHKVEKSDKS